MIFLHVDIFKKLVKLRLLWIFSNGKSKLNSPCVAQQFSPPPPPSLFRPPELALALALCVTRSKQSVDHGGRGVRRSSTSSGVGIRSFPCPVAAQIFLQAPSPNRFSFFISVPRPCRVCLFFRLIWLSIVFCCPRMVILMWVELFFWFYGRCDGFVRGD